MRYAFNKEIPKIFVQKSRWMLAYLRQELIGIAEDFWKDGGNEKIVKQNGVCFSEPLSPDPTVEKYWHAAPGEIEEKLWGSWNIFPGDSSLAGLLVQPFNITKGMNLLDLSAGLGGRMRGIYEEFKISVAGREADPEIAARGMDLLIADRLDKYMSITPYDPMALTDKNSYDCIILRETIYRAADKERFIKSIEACCNDEAQVSFTDYIVNPENRTEPAIIQWQKYEFGAEPLSLVEMAELWARAGFSLRVHDDQTDYYKKEVKRGLLRLAQFMLSGVKPDAETKTAIEKQLTLWALRTAALEKGMKFYRFYGLK